MATAALIIMVRDQGRLLAKSLAHHLKLFDRVVLLDHRSRTDLRGLDLPGLDVWRINLDP